MVTWIGGGCDFNGIGIRKLCFDLLWVYRFGLVFWCRSVCVDFDLMVLVLELGVTLGLAFLMFD